MNNETIEQQSDPLIIGEESVNEPEVKSIGTVTVQNISRDSHTQWHNPANVKFNVKYAKDYKGVKHMPEGQVVVSKETADHFTKIGIGSIEKAK